MGDKPKRSDYQASETEKASAEVGKMQRERFKRLYDPLLREMRDQSMSDDPTRQLRGRANADTMQALTSNLQFRNTQQLDRTGDIAQATLGQLGQAGAQGKQIENQLRTNVVGIANQQGADAASGLAQAARMQTSEQLNRARARQQVRSARAGAAAQLAGATLMQGVQNMQTRGLQAPVDAAGNRLAGPPQPVQGTFFQPVSNAGPVSGFRNRLNYSGTLYDPNNPYSPFGGG